ncbi:unnamed protein product [Arctogadus glacialis]
MHRPAVPRTVRDVLPSEPKRKSIKSKLRSALISERMEGANIEAFENQSREYFGTDTTRIGNLLLETLHGQRFVSGGSPGAQVANKRMELKGTMKRGTSQWGTFHFLVTLVYYFKAEAF